MAKFKEIYDGLPKRTTKTPKGEFVENIARICMVSDVTVRCWLSGTQKPDALRQSIISKELGVPATELF